MTPSALLNKSILYAKLHNHYFSTCDSCIFNPHKKLGQCNKNEKKIMLVYHKKNNYSLSSFERLGRWELPTLAWCIKGLLNKQEQEKKYEW